LTALIAEMAGTLADSRSIIQNFCPSVLGFSITLGTIQMVLARGSQSLETSCKMISEQVRKEKINHIDETSWHKNGILMWMRVMANTTSAFFMIHFHRFRATVDRVALFADFKTVILPPHAHVKYNDAWNKVTPCHCQTQKT
jgi:transposase